MKSKSIVKQITRSFRQIINQLEVITSDLRSSSFDRSIHPSPATHPSAQTWRERSGWYVSETWDVCLRWMVVIGRWKFLCIQFDILQSRACHNLCLIILYRVHPIRFKYTHVPVRSSNPSPVLGRSLCLCSALNDGMLPLLLPLSFSPTWSVDKCQSVDRFADEIKAVRGIHYDNDDNCWEQKISSCDHSPSIRSDSIQFNADDRACHAPTRENADSDCLPDCLPACLAAAAAAYQGPLSPLIIVMVESCVVLRRDATRWSSSYRLMWPLLEHCMQMIRLVHIPSTSPITQGQPDQPPGMRSGRRVM